MSQNAPLTDHEAVKKTYEVLARAINHAGAKSPLLNHLKEKHREVYDGLISECKTHGPGIKQSIRDFTADASKVAPKNRIASARKALTIFETLPKEMTHPKSRLGLWAAGIAGAGAVAGYFINAYGKENAASTSATNAEPYNVLSPEERERRKSKEQQAEDIAYTINHSIYCTLTDFLNPPINAATDGYLRYLIPGCGHDHSKDGDFGHSHHGEAHALPEGATRWQKVKHATKNALSKERFMQYAKGEFIGDFGAVLPTIALQRVLPSFMNGLKKLSEPIMRPIFSYGIESSSKRWAKREGVATDSQEYKDHVAKVYDHEMEHFPQAIVWTGFSLGLNTAYQMHSDKTPMQFMNKLALKTSSVLSGILVTAGVVVAARALAPHKMRDIDQWTSSNAILPATKTVGKFFGVNEKDVDRMAQKQLGHDDENSWSSRVQAPVAANAMSL